MGKRGAQGTQSWINAAAIVTFLGLSPLPALADPALDDDFKTGALDFTNWCPCQINMQKSPYSFAADPGNAKDRMLSIPVDDSSLGGNKCRKQAPDFECRPPASIAAIILEREAESASRKEPLGPSFFDQHGLRITALRMTNPYCTEEILRRAKAAGEEGECFERQELRAQDDHAPPANERYTYEIRFRMPAKVEDDRNSIRWVIGQWKQEPVAERYGKEFGDDWGPSPFLAQRYDDGVLHVTIQEEHCRCLVASAPMPGGKAFEWHDGVARQCFSTHPAHEGEDCKSTLTLKYGPKPTLESPAGKFVDMKYVVQADHQSKARIDVYQNGRFIVSVKGAIGYDIDKNSHAVTKFKIGHYRDYMPYPSVIDIDSIKIGKAAP
jgi:hypothetical protein